MIKHHTVPTVLFAFLLVASAGSAQADIMQCVDAKGQVTFTDVACGTDADADADASGALAPKEVKPTIISPSSQKKRLMAAEKARSVAWAKKRPASRALALDVATMSAARAVMTTMDHASDLARQQAREERLVAEEGWGFWRS